MLPTAQGMHGLHSQSRIRMLIESTRVRLFTPNPPKYIKDI